MKLLLVIGIIAFSLSLRLFAQIPFSQLESDVSIRNIRAIHRDSDGYLWVGSDIGAVGLLRYDGHQFRRYQNDPEREDSLSGSSIYDIEEDSEGRLWVATDGGLSRYDWNYDSFIRYPRVGQAEEALENKGVLQVIETPSLEVWALSNDSLYRYDSVADAFERFAPSADVIGEVDFTGCVADLEGNIWIVEEGARVWRFRLGSQSFSHSDVLSGHLIRATTEKKIICDGSGRLWISDPSERNRGLFRFFPDTMEIESFDFATDEFGARSNAVRDLIEYPEGQILLASKGGLTILDTETGGVLHQRFDEDRVLGLSSNNLWALHRDADDSLWLGNVSSGVDVYKPSFGEFDTYRRVSIFPEKTLPEFEVISLFENFEGDIVIGMRFGGLCVLDSKTKELRRFEYRAGDPHSIPEAQIRGLDQSRDGRLWMATWGEGVRVMRKQNGNFVNDFPEKEKLSAYALSSIWDIEIDRQERTWLSFKGAGGMRIIHLLDKDLNLIKEHIFDASGVPGWQSIFAEGAGGEILISGMGGVYRFSDERQEFERFIETESIVASIAFDSVSKRLYVGTQDQGLLIFDHAGTLLGNFNRESGLPSFRVNSIIVQNENEVWLGTYDGLCRYFPNDEKAFVYHETDGLQGDRYSHHTAIKTSEGILYFGGFEGFSGFDPNRIIDSESPPSVSIDSVALHGTPLSHRDPDPLINAHPQGLEKVTLDWRQNQLSFSFMGINVMTPEKNRYAYQLEGLDEDWLYADASQRIASYANLSPGSYTFRVKASRSHGVWGEEEARIRVVITPPFWQRWWFYILSSSFFCLTIFAFVRIRERQLRKDRERLEVMVEEKTQELKAHREQLEVTVEKRTKELVVARDTAERSQAEAQEALAQAEESDRLKSQFLANLSHEIRTPLNAINGFAALMGDRALDDDSHERYMEIISENSDSLLTLIDDILDFSLIAANQMRIDDGEILLNPFVDNIHSSFALRENEKEIKHVLDNSLHAEELVLLGDQSRIKQVIDNLMTNALKFTSEGYVKLGVYRKLDTINFYVEDSGPGIPSGEMGLIFEKFVKRHVDDRAARRGVGLGLAICKRLAQLMNGELTVESKVGKGSTFTLSLPLRVIEEAPHRKEKVRKIVENRGKRVLVIEDEEANYKFLEVVLRKAGIDTIWANNGEAGLAVLESQEAFDLVLLDIKMPGIDGYETLKRIRKGPREIKVIAQTAYAMKSDENKIRHAGFDGYLAKPINRARLMELVEANL